MTKVIVPYVNLLPYTNINIKEFSVNSSEDYYYILYRVYYDLKILVDNNIVENFLEKL